ncbi:hypothetical protein CDL15_Pgr018143 [Punica granatum]|uniref:Uncharacterized protein n=1 Tax=Punica granatum TaxID=22663 RepID=A0A218WIC7_PUNGR|nr:hypothetical protein CDL15_Pgr018143 [Punica granatum]
MKEAKLSLSVLPCEARQSRGLGRGRGRQTRSIDVVSGTRGKGNGSGLTEEELPVGREEKENERRKEAVFLGGGGRAWGNRQRVQPI